MMTKEHKSVGKRVQVCIENTTRYAMGCAVKLDGKKGVISAYSPSSYNGQDKGGNPGPAFLVEFDTPAEPWYSNSSPHSAFWLPPCDLFMAGVK